MNNLGYIVLAYFLGAIPFGYILPKLFKGEDVREYGSGNIGFTNVLRTFGPILAGLVLLGDASKGFVSVWLAVQTGSELLPLATAIAAVVGHSWTLFLRFQGGRGLATSAGAILALMPKVVGVLFLVWLAILLLFRYVSLASVSVAIAFPIVTLIAGYSWPYCLFSLILALVVIWRHRPNIKRLLAGTELKLGQKGERKSAR